MKRELEPYQMIERSIIKKYRKELWTPFIVAVKRYELVQEGDKIAVCISGGKDSMLMAKLMQELQKHSDVPFELVFLVMDPGQRHPGGQAAQHQPRQCRLQAGKITGDLEERIVELDSALNAVRTYPICQGLPYEGSWRASA